jgi:hypothetical protein
MEFDARIWSDTLYDFNFDAAVVLEQFLGEQRRMTDARVQRKQARAIEFWNVERSVIGIDVFTCLDSLQELQGIIDQPVHPLGLSSEISILELLGIV